MVAACMPALPAGSLTRTDAMHFRRPIPVFACGAALLFAFASARAQVPPPQGVVSLAASATIEVPRDLMTVTLSTTREGADAALVQAQLKQALDAALAEARKVARPGQLDLQTGNFSLMPRYAPKGGLSGWQGSAELIVEGRDLPAIGQLVGRITTLTVARVGYSLSREVREKAESDAGAQAIARYRAKAADVARQFGYSGYTIREVNVNTNEPPPIRPMAFQTRALQAPSADEPLPVEAGNGTVVVNVAGTIQMK
jgi:predicted secreted protein